MEINKITIITKDHHINGRFELEEIRLKLENMFCGKIYFETSGETVADCIIEKEKRETKQIK